MERVRDLTPIIENMTLHVAADELVRGTGFKDGHGCFIGCSIDEYDHRSWAAATDSPEWLAYLCDTLHENMSDEVDRGVMALEILDAMQYCRDYSNVEHGIHLFIQLRNVRVVEALDAEVKEELLPAIKRVIELHENPAKFTKADWWAAWSTAHSIATSTAGRVEAVARSAAWAAKAGAGSMRAVAEAVACSAWAVADWWSAEWTAAYIDEYDAIGQELIHLLRANA